MASPKIVLATSAWVGQKMSSGVHQLERGLEEAGVTLVGSGYHCRGEHLPTLVSELSPDILLIQEATVWDRPDRGPFTGVEELRNLGVTLGTFHTDLGSLPEYHKAFHEKLRPHLIITRYPTQSVRQLTPWTPTESVVRSHWTLDPAEVPAWSDNRNVACVSGAPGSVVYPLRSKIINSRSRVITKLTHPGYHLSGESGSEYMRRLSGFKVAICTTSKYKFFLRKIIEATAAGCIVLADGPNEVVPAISGNVRTIPSSINITMLERVCIQLAKHWDPEEQRNWARKAVEYYDYRRVGAKLVKDLEERHATLCQPV